MEEYINADDVIFFFLYLMNKMRGNLVKLPGTIKVDDVIAFCSLLDLCWHSTRESLINKMRRNLIEISLPAFSRWLNWFDKFLDR